MMYGSFRTLMNRPTKATHIFRTDRDATHLPWKVGVIRGGKFIAYPHKGIYPRFTAEELKDLSNAVHVHRHKVRQIDMQDKRRNR